MAANNIGGIKVKGGVPCRDYLVDRETDIGRSLRQARKSNSEVNNRALDMEIKAIEFAMRRK